MPLDSGSRVSHYQLIEQIGEGGMGTVWKAYDTQLRRHVAMKVLPPAFADDAGRLARFEHEARILASLDHPNIVTVHAVESSGGVHYFTMELVLGQTLDRVVPPRGLPWASWLDIAGALADALASAHARGVIHRDIKPANLMVSDDGRVKVLDFGLARTDRALQPFDPAEASTEDPHEPGRFSGTLTYMAPERLRGEPADARADVFSLGIILYAMASGRHPFAASTAVECAAAILRDPPPPLRTERPDLPETAGALVIQCLDKDPAARIDSRTLRDRIDVLRARERVARVADADPDVPPAGHSRDAAAYDLYRRARGYVEQYSRIGVEQALALLTKAVERDPRYALAWAGIAECHSFLFLYADGSDIDRDRADAASVTALVFGPDLGPVRVARGLALSLGSRHGEAEPEFEAALKLDPRSFDAHYFYARDRFMEGQLDRAIELYERASTLRPADPQPPLLVAQIYDDLGRPDEARASRRRGVEAAAARLDLHPDDTRALYMGANGLVALGEIDRGLEWARRAFERDPHDPVLLYNLACIYALAGRRDEALDHLDRTVDAGLMRIDWLRRDSNLDPIRDHPRFAAALARIERAAAARRTGAIHR